MIFKKKFLKPTATVLLVILTLCVLFACASNEDSNTTTPTNPTQSNTQGVTNDDPDTPPKAVEEERILAEVPVVNYGGHTFKVATFGVQGSYEWENVDIYAEAINGDPINDAVFTRNKVIEEKYNITIEDVHLYDNLFDTSVRNAIHGGTNDYDLVSPRVVSSGGYILDGLFLNLFTAPNLDLTKPWWDSQAIEEISIQNKVFILLSDILLSDDNATTITIFNKKILADNGIDYPYAMAKEGKWTFDKLYEMARDTAVDVDGNGRMTPEIDVFGYLTWSDAMISFLHSGGERLVSKNAEDLPELTFSNERTYEIAGRALEFLCDPNVTGNIQKTAFSAAYGDGAIGFEQIFSSNRCAFAWVRLYMVPRLRFMDADFGILPIPKMYEHTEKYISTVNVHTACSLAIPKSVSEEDLNRTTIIMEALAAESSYHLPEAYYEVTLKGKQTRDEESREMLDLILSNRAIDLGDVYNFAGFGHDFYRLALYNDTNVTSFYERYESSVNTEINKLIAQFDRLD